MQTIWLIRHGKTLANTEMLYCGRSDLPLTPEGEAELRALKRKGGYPDPEGLRRLTSGMRRTEKTAELLFGGSWEREPAFREMDFGDFELQSYEMLKDQPAYQAWLEGDNEQNPCPGGESGAEMTRRVLEAWKRLVSEGRDAVVVTHGGPIAAVMQTLFPQRFASRYEAQPAPGHGWAITLENGAAADAVPVPPPAEIEEERFLSRRWAVIAGLLLAGAVLALMGLMICSANGLPAGVVAFAVLTGALFVASQAVRLIKLRCPYCGKTVAPLRGFGSGKCCCFRCGKAYRYDGGRRNGGNG